MRKTNTRPPTQTQTGNLAALGNARGARVLKGWGMCQYPWGEILHQMDHARAQSLSLFLAFTKCYFSFTGWYSGKQQEDGRFFLTHQSLTMEIIIFGV